MENETQEQYLATLKQERHLYAWCLVHVGNYSLEDAREKAESFYKFSNDAYRELVFHDEAWHWAMLFLKGEGYWRDCPDLLEPSLEYESERERIVNED